MRELVQIASFTDMEAGADTISGLTAFEYDPVLHAYARIIHPPDWAVYAHVYGNITDSAGDAPSGAVSLYTPPPHIVPTGDLETMYLASLQAVASANMSGTGLGVGYSGPGVSGIANDSSGPVQKGNFIIGGAPYILAVEFAKGGVVAETYTGTIAIVWSGDAD